MSSARSALPLTRTLRDLLFREAHFRLLRQRITPLFTAKEAEVRSIEATRSPFTALLPRRKHEYLQKLSSAQDAATTLRERLTLLDQCEPELRRRIEDEIEQVLREYCPEYVQALAAQRQKEDWLRCLERFGTRIFELRRAVGNARNLACSGYAPHTQSYSLGAQQAFTLASAAAGAVADEVKFANAISDAQRRTFEESGVRSRVLPKFPETDFVAWIERIAKLPIAGAQAEFDRLIDQAQQLHETGIGELRTQADLVEHEQEAAIHNFLLVAWEQFRGQITGEVFPGDTDRVVTETAGILQHAARTSVKGRL